jgi:SAM-dependent methyltransferase
MHARACAPDSFYAQVKHTVAGTPVSPEQIAMIVQSVRSGLSLEAADRILDLCCGNGALTTEFFAACGGGLGVDFCETLITIANRHFVRRPQEAFRLQDVVDYARNADDTAGFTKAVCHGGFQYLPPADAQELLELLRQRFVEVKRVFLGNLPDKRRIDAFFRDRDRVAGVENDSASPLGIWRTEDEIHSLSAKTGWTATIVPMNARYYAAHYRYDVLLKRR